MGLDVPRLRSTSLAGTTLGEMRVQLIAKPMPSPSTNVGMTGTSRHAQGLYQGLQAAGVDASVGSPRTLPLPTPLLQGMKRLGVDLPAFFASYPLRTPLHRADVYHITTQTMATLLWLQRFPAPVVVTVLDIIPYLVRGHRELDTSRHAIDRLFYRLALGGLARANALVTISEYTKRTLIENLRLPADRIYTVYPAVDGECFRPLDVPEAFRTQYGLRTGWRYVLYVGSDDPRKNLTTLVQVFASVQQMVGRVKLLKVGASQYPQERLRLLALVEELGIQEDVRFFGKVPETDLPCFYNLADVLAMPSLLEGFGLPVAEAMACGLPVVCSTETSLPEVAGSAGLLVDPGNVHELAGALAQVLEDRTLADSLRSKGLERAAMFTLGHMAEGILRVYAAVGA
jgi:glycosyltransferase involved in cell wall biosynthesis